jgi:hypothetical protein
MGTPNPMTRAPMRDDACTSDLHRRDPLGRLGLQVGGDAELTEEPNHLVQVVEELVAGHFTTAIGYAVRPW